MTDDDVAVTLVDEEPLEQSYVRRRRGRAPSYDGEAIAGRYRLGVKLGEGGAGVVYEAFDDVRRERVALKLLHPGLRTSKDHVARFWREVRALSAIPHSGIVRVHDAGEAGRRLYLVMELLEGELLFDRIREGLDAKEVVEIGRQLLGALAAAHAHGVVHRDVKPENLFLARAPSGAVRVKILDFGIAKLIREDRPVSFQTLDGMILGTPEYMSPELCKGEPVTGAADLWATAAVLFHAFTGAPPFDADHVGKLLLQIVRGRAPLLAERRPDLPPHVAHAIDRALDPDPARRFPTAQAFATALATSAPIDDLDWDA